MAEELIPIIQIFENHRADWNEQVAEMHRDVERSLTALRLQVELGREPRLSQEQLKYLLSNIDAVVAMLEALRYDLVRIDEEQKAFE